MKIRLLIDDKEPQVFDVEEFNIYYGGINGADVDVVLMSKEFIDNSVPEMEAEGVGKPVSRGFGDGAELEGLTLDSLPYVKDLLVSVRKEKGVTLSSGVKEGEWDMKQVNIVTDSYNIHEKDVMEQLVRMLVGKEREYLVNPSKDTLFITGSPRFYFDREGGDVFLDRVHIEESAVVYSPSKSL